MRLLLVALALCAGAATGEVAGAQPQQPAKEVFVESVDVNVVNVSVFVTGKDGLPITGLTKADFEILEDGRPVEISNFYAIEEGMSVDRSGLTELDPGAEAGRTAIEPLPLPEDQRLHLILYVDNFNLRPSHRNRVLRRLRRFVYQKVGEDDRVMVVSYDRSLNIRQTFTSDRGLVAARLADLEGLTAAAVSRDAERRIAIEEIERVDNAVEAVSEASSYAASVTAETRFALRGIRTMTEMLAGLPGRKAIVYISDGIPRIPGEDLFMAVDQRFPRSRARMDAFSYDLLHEYDEIGVAANAAGVTFYTLDAGGLAAHESISAAEGGTVQGGGRAFIDGIRQANLEDPLFRMADDTGGLAFVNTNAVEAALDRMTYDFRTLYSLGYQPGHTGDGRYHKIEVKVKRKGARVRHRTGYRDKTLESRIAEGSLATLRFGIGENRLQADLEFGVTQASGNGNYQLPIQLKLPIGELALVPVGEFNQARVRVAVTVMDGDGDVSPVRQQPSHDIRIPTADLQNALGKHYSYGLELLLRPGRHTIAVAVRDEFGAQTSYLSRSITIGS